jgi:SAM-dependent methyltransferase
MVTVQDLAPVLLRQQLAYVEVPVDHDVYGKRVEFDAERCLALAEIAAVAPPRRVLEVGVGYLSLLTTFRTVFGDELELSGLEHPLRAFLDDPGFKREIAELNVDLRTCDLVTDPLPFPAGSFDAILFSEIIEHLCPVVVPGVLTRLRELLAPGGRLIVSSPNLGAFYRIASLAIGHGHVMDISGEIEQHPGVYGHQRLYTRSDVDLLAVHCGCRVATWKWLEWERGLIGRSYFSPRRTRRGQLLAGAQAVASRLAPRWSCGWACALEPAPE